MLDASGQADFPFELGPPSSHEAITLRLDPSRTYHRLGWRPVLDAAATIQWTADWYRRYLESSSSARALSDEQLKRFEGTLEAASPLAAAR